ncbi:Purine nucleoside phosphorylase, variant 2 [Clonorchis sinensis]|uniref:purine-nucleoside phosphorylase n=1 Tax=Clonorchis sinensis TaxID=79923 RepID=A0A8T1M2P2_CLOSI|nr:Purine nucleoside phosphorylase, variant 2 [Clonorchis sinensis]
MWRSLNGQNLVHTQIQPFCSLAFPFQKMEATSFQAIQKIADHIQKLVKLKPSVGIIAGTGLGVLATVVEPKHTIAYKHIPGFPQTTVAGHDGNLVFGMIAEKAVVIMQGRFHHYEGFSAEQIVLPIRVLKLLGVETLLISNAAGGLSKNLEVGDFVILTDHISLAGLTTDNVLVGPNDEQNEYRARSGRGSTLRDACICDLSSD